MSDLLGPGFSEPQRLRSIDPGCPAAPSEGGIYVVTVDEPKALFVSESAGGHFKGRDPKVDTHMLDAKWVDGASVLYIGKAKSLRRRIDQFARFGRGEPIGHWGGRYLWQLADPDSLLVCWKVDPNPGNAEADLISDFIETHETLPFANLNRPRRTGARA